MSSEQRSENPNAGGSHKGAPLTEVDGNDLRDSEAISKLLSAISPARVVVLTSPYASRSSMAEFGEKLAATVPPPRIFLDLPDEVDAIAALTGAENPIHAVLDQTEALRAVGLDVGWRVPLTEDSVWKLDGLFFLAHERNVLALPDAGRSLTSDDARLFAWDFLTYALLDEYRSHFGPAAISYLEAVQSTLALDRRDQITASPAPPETLMARALADGSSTVEARPAIGRADIIEVVGHGLRAHAAASTAPSARRTLPTKLSSALLVGAYGGDHIGDLAILGGVLRRLHEEFGLERAVLLTQRCAHTQHLVNMLETPVQVTVDEYQIPQVRRRLAQADALVHAGGPLTDIPKQLVRHLFAASVAKRTGKPFLMEGIGPNVFPRKGSAVTARRLVKLADRITVRTSDDAARPVVDGVDLTIGHDPAFDYLATRGPNLTRLAPQERAQIDTLLAGTEGRAVVGINIRPIGDLYTPVAAGEDRAARTLQVVERMERELAQGLTKFARESAVPPRFIFFPMNAIQFGMSDSRSAYRIIRHMDRDLDVQVWQADASLDAVVALLRRMNTAITMRFHATIFAFSQKCLPIGVDYRVGKKDKVTAIMEDNGALDFCTRIDLIDADWLAARLKARTQASVAAASGTA